MTERPEAVEAGTVKRVGTDGQRILHEAGQLLDDEEAYAAATRSQSVWGRARV